MTRFLKYSTIALTMALLVFLYAGCGEEEASLDARKAVTGGRGETRVEMAQEAKQQAGDSEKPEMLIGQVIAPTENSPQEFTESIEERRPIAVTFYMLGPYDDSKVRTTMTSLESQYKGQMDFYTYLYSDGERYKDLASLLLVNTTPTVVIINGESRVQQAWTGFADEQSLEQGIVEALKAR